MASSWCELFLGKCVQLISTLCYKKIKLALICVWFVPIFLNYLMFRFVDVIGLVTGHIELMLNMKDGHSTKRVSFQLQDLK